MLRQTHLAAAAALVALGLIGACTQDFSEFEPDGSSQTTTTSTGTAGGAGGAGGGTTTTTTTTTTTGPVDPEICGDGVDNDMDGAVDCADSDDCGAFECVSPPGGPWQGPGLLYVGPEGMVPDCPADFPDIAFEGVADLMAQDASCTACACGAPAVTCAPSPLRAYFSDNCSGNSQNLPQPMMGMCQTITPPSGTDSYRAQAPAATAGACAASGGDATVPSLEVSTARLCSAALSGGGCGGQNEVCVPSDIGAPFVGKVCVWRSGDQGCPGAFSEKHLLGTDVDDTRGCSACACGDANASCAATTVVYSDDACMSQLAVVNNDNTCVTAVAGGSIMITYTGVATCTPLGGQPTGEAVLEGDLQTVCCMP